MAMPPPPPPPPPLPSLIGGGGKGGAGGSPSGPPGDRSNLMNEIRKAGGLGGKVQLKKAVTNDRSAPIVGNSPSVSRNESSGSLNSPSRMANGPLKSANSSSSMSFQDQLNAAVGMRGTGKSPQHGAFKSGASGGSPNAVIQKSDGGPRPLPPTPGSKPSPPVAKSQAPSPPYSSEVIRPSANANANSPPAVSNGSSAAENFYSGRPKSLTAAEISDSTKNISVHNIKNQLFSGSGVPGGPGDHQNSQIGATGGPKIAPPPPPPMPPVSTVRPPPPSKPAHLAGPPMVPPQPPPPPSRPPSQRPPLTEVKNRRPDFRTMRPQRLTANQNNGVQRSNSDENLHKQAHNQETGSTPVNNNNRGPATAGGPRPAPPPPPQRPPPLPPSSRPTGAPPPPPPPKIIQQPQQNELPKRPIANGTPRALPETAPPPPPRTDSLTSDFEKRFRFRTLSLLPSPDDFRNKSKMYAKTAKKSTPAPRIP